MSTILTEYRPVTDKEALSNISKNVRRLRGERSMSWLANEVGTYPANISRLEKAGDMPGAGLLSRLAIVLDTTVDELLAPPPKK